jgi:serine/threonine protein kinase
MFSFCCTLPPSFSEIAFFNPSKTPVIHIESEKRGVGNKHFQVELPEISTLNCAFKKPQPTSSSITLSTDPFSLPGAVKTEHIAFPTLQAKRHPTDYEFLTRSCAAGGNSVVSQGRHIDSGQLAAIKQIKHPCLQKTMDERTKWEIQALKDCDHPHIVKLLDLSFTEHETFLILEWIEGIELFDYLNKCFEEKRFPSAEEIQKISSQIVSALAHLHEKGFPYRDLKPENIMMQETGDIKLVDLGCCKPIGRGRTQSFLGTVGYFHPEMLKKADYSVSCDWWMLGVLLFEMATLQRPFPDSDDEEARTKIVQQEYVFPSDVDIDPNLQDLIAKLLKPESERLGSRGAHEVKAHPFFEGVDWDELEGKQGECF